MSYLLHHGDCREVMAGMEPGSVDAVVTDPPYGLNFMGKKWDAPGSFVERRPETGTTFDHIGGNHHACNPHDGARSTGRANRRAQDWHHAWAVAALRVLKPSHYLLAFGGTRTWHRLACALEDAGFEIRDTLMWLYGSGFPKGKACLKPAWEPVILARKPGPMRELGIDECRIDTPVDSYATPGNDLGRSDVYGGWGGKYEGATERHPESVRHHAAGRWPANVVLDEAAAAMVDEASGILSSHPGTYRNVGAAGCYSPERPVGAVASTGDSGGASRFYFIAKGDPCDANTAGMSSCPLSGLDASALNDAATLAAREATRPPRGSQATPAFTTSCAVCTQTPNPALCAALLANIGITTTTASLSKSDGSVLGVTADCTSPASAARAGDGSDPESGTRFLYCAKASRRERNAGLEGMPDVTKGSNFGLDGPRPHTDPDYKYEATSKNVHPTVKPVALMRWLVRLVARPGDVVLDPFTGSGTTGVACAEEGRDFIGIEKEAEYVEIARRRIEAAAAQERLPV